MKRLWILFLLGVLFIYPSYSAPACSTPVFRYAMERWPADYYEGIVIHKGPLAEDEPAVMLLQTGNSEFLNLRVSPVDLSSSDVNDLTGLLGGPVPERLPELTGVFPEGGSLKGKALGDDKEQNHHPQAALEDATLPNSKTAI